ncbi:hypothetical protein [Mangrovicoccus sp. HB161399]|uniref:hypothetical protein n=1 Tax=Mangrovicoccus sp. HB161399 TaxID=2720392 RepID=UPI001554E77A|nr:hypothetical protein [Mangrovicoccus sp. HB161399]
MTFTKIGQRVAFLAVALGGVAIIASFFVGPTLFPDSDRASMKQSGLFLRQGATMLFCGLILGVLCEISEKLEIKNS